MRAAAQRYEEALEKRRIAENTFNASINELEVWLDDAERLMQTKTEAIEKHQQQAVSSEWLKDQLDEHKKFFEKLQEVGQTSLVTVNRSYDELISLYDNDKLDFGVTTETAQSNIVPPNDALDNVVVEASAKVKMLRDRYEVSSISTNQNVIGNRNRIPICFHRVFLLSMLLSLLLSLLLLLSLALSFAPFGKGPPNHTDIECSSAVGNVSC